LAGDGFYNPLTNLANTNTCLIAASPAPTAPPALASGELSMIVNKSIIKALY
jgi:hypothetical protein